MSKLKKVSPQRGSLMLVITVAEGLDAFNSKDETYIDVKVFDDMKVSTMHRTIAKVLQLKREDRFFYVQEKSKHELDQSLTFKENRVKNGDKLFLEGGRKRRGTGSKSKREDIEHIEGDSEVLELLCTTRIFDSDYNTLRRVRVLVCAEDTCATLMNDVSTLWGRTGLKFKCGRTVLTSDKSFADQKVENNAEIVVTGGRG